MLNFTVPDMTCGHCVSAITRAVSKLDPDAKIAADLTRKIVTVETHAAADAVSASIKAAGYENTPV